MIVYIYDNNFLYAGKQIPQKHPLKAGFLVPANSTNVAPPEEYSVNEVPKFNGTGWELVPSPYKEAQDAALKEQQLKLLDTTNSYGICEYKLDEEGNVVFKSEEELALENAPFILEETKANLKYALDEAIFNKAKEITKGTDISSVQSFVQAYQLRAANPELYVSQNIQVRYAIDVYQLGEILDTAEKIKDYYTKVLVYLDTFREALIMQYVIDKAALENTP